MQTHHDVAHCSRVVAMHSLARAAVTSSKLAVNMSTVGNYAIQLLETSRHEAACMHLSMHNRSSFAPSTRAILSRRDGERTIAGVEATV